MGKENLKVWFLLKFVLIFVLFLLFSRYFRSYLIFLVGSHKFWACRHLHTTIFKMICKCRKEPFINDVTVFKRLFERKFVMTVTFCWTSLLLFKLDVIYERSHSDSCHKISPTFNDFSMLSIHYTIKWDAVLLHDQVN